MLAITGSQQIAARSEAGKLQTIATIYERYVREFPDVTGLTVKEFQQLKEREHIIIVDVRTPEERAVSIIPDAISQSEFEQNISHYKNYPIVIYCTIGYRSGKYAQKLSETGLNIFNLEGSLLAWSHLGGEVVNSSGKTKKIHVFNNRWQLTADNYQPVW